MLWKYLTVRPHAVSGGSPKPNNSCVSFCRRPARVAVAIARARPHYTVPTRAHGVVRGARAAVACAVVQPPVNGMLASRCAPADAPRGPLCGPVSSRMHPVACARRAGTSPPPAMSDFLIIPNDENFHSQSLANVEHVRAPLFSVFTLHVDVAVPVRRAWEPSRPCAFWIQTFHRLRAPCPRAPRPCVVCVSFHVHLCAPCRPWARAGARGEAPRG